METSLDTIDKEIKRIEKIMPILYIVWGIIMVIGLIMFFVKPDLAWVFFGTASIVALWNYSLGRYLEGFVTGQYYESVHVLDIMEKMKSKEKEND